MPRFAIIIMLLPSVLLAQQDTLLYRKPDLARAADAVAFTFSAPARWNGKDYLKLGFIAGGTAAISLLDKPVRNFWKDKHSPLLDGFQVVGNHYGKPYTAVAITGSLYFAGLAFKNEWARETGLMLASGLGTSTVIQTLLKNAVGRARPNLDLGNYEMSPLREDSPYHSLPSGHTTVAFTTSLVLAQRVESVPLKIFFYSIASVTAASRLYLDVHWISDVALGTGIAWACANAAIKRLELNRFRAVAQKNGVIVKLYPYPGGISLRASL